MWKSNPFNSSQLRFWLGRSAKTTSLSITESIPSWPWPTCSNQSPYKPPSEASPPSHSAADCPRIKERVSCDACGYPASEACFIMPYNTPKQVHVIAGCVYFDNELNCHYCGALRD